MVGYLKNWYNALTMPANIFITGHIPNAGITLLKDQGFRVSMHTGKKPISRRELLRRVKNCDAIIPLLTDQIDKKVMEAAGDKLKIIAGYNVGYDHIDLAAAQKKNIIVTNTANTSEASVAEFSMALMLSLAARITEADQFVRKGKFKSWQSNLLNGTMLSGKTLGIVGMGRIGAAVAQMAHRGLNMNIIYHDAIRNHHAEIECGARSVSFAKLLEDADVISIHAPLLPTTKHLFTASAFRQMKPTALLINTARGPIVDEKALVSALKRKQIAGAALDVFENEPKLAKGLTKLSNCILTPHIASATAEARNAMSEVAAKNVIAVLHNQPALTPVQL